MPFIVFQQNVFQKIKNSFQETTDIKTAYSNYCFINVLFTQHLKAAAIGVQRDNVCIFKEN